MKIDEIKVGEVLELDGQNKKGEQVTVQFEVIEKSFYPSKVNGDILFPGLKCRFDGDKEEILDFFILEFARKVTQ
ncbi:MAG: hypothetical protein ACKUBY_00025 [Candidatus Moraniibacteriota bacterium]|jgi:hypothetical protein